MRSTLSTISLLILAVHAGCRYPSAQCPSVPYEKDGLSFTYPRSWSVAKDLTVAGNRLVVLESPDGSSVTIQVVEEAPMLEDFCRDFTKLVNEELKNTVISNLTTGKPDSEQGGVLRITQTFSATRANSEVDYRRDFIRLKRENRIVFVVCQAPADQWPDFSSSCNQLLQSLK